MPKKGKKGKEKVSLEEFDTTPMSKDQLVKLCIRLQEEKKREQAERNFFMMERDKLRAFWEVTRKQLDDVRAELRDKDHRLDDDDMAHLSEIKFHEQKILFTMLEYQTSIAKMKIENMKALNKAQQDIWADMGSLRMDNEEAAEEATNMTITQQRSIQDGHMEHSVGVTQMRDDHVVTVVDVSGHFERQVTIVRAEANERHRLELAAMAELQRVQAEQLLKNHAQALTDLKNYYNEITLNNLSLVGSLKAECGELREREDRAVQLARALRTQNKELAGPLREAREELSELRRQMQHFERDQMELERATARAHAAEKELRDVRWEMDVMQILLDKVRDERIELGERLKKVQAELRLRRAKTQMRAERRVRDLRAALEYRNAESAIAQMPGPTCQRLAALQPLLDEKNKRIAQLTLEVARLQKAHATTMQQLRGALREREADFDDGLRVPPARAATPDEELD